jgi:hypothetical protein
MALVAESSDRASLAAADLCNPQSLNRYAYVLNAPTIYTDILGLDVDAGIPGFCPAEYSSEECHGGGGGGWGGDWGGGGIGIGIGGGGGGGRGGNGSGGTTTGSTGNSGGIGNFPNGEHLGLPTGYNFATPSWCQFSGLCPMQPGCEFGSCGTFGYDGSDTLVWQIAPWIIRTVPFVVSASVAVATVLVLQRGDGLARVKVTVRCNVVDTSRGFEDTIGQVTVQGEGHDEASAVLDGKKLAGDLVAAHRPGQRVHVRHCRQVK